MMTTLLIFLSMMVPVFHLGIKKYNWYNRKWWHKNVEIWVPLKYLSNVWRTLQIPLINCEISLILTWSESCALTSGGQVPTLAITDTKLYFPVLALSTQDNIKIMEQLKSGFERTINWNKYQSKVSIERKKRY